jgi:hypothetical protein
MPYDENDPRARLGADSAARSTGPGDGGFAAASYVKFYESPPQLRDAGGSTWIGRGQHFVLAYSELAPGASLERSNQSDEYFVLLPDETKAEVGTDEGAVLVDGRSVLIVPPGPSQVTLPEGGRAVRLFTSEALDLLALAANAGAYATPAPKLAPLVAWPEPVDGYRLRRYPLDIEQTGSRFGRIWRSRSLMVNYSYPRPGPRDVTKMSPHAHDDFEQGSLVLDGSFVHHIRWPWTTDMRTWRHDEHEICAGPSLAVIPAQSIHTSQQVGREINQLVDVFAPPRSDFSQMDGWVLNADEYPTPG